MTRAGLLPNKVGVVNKSSRHKKVARAQRRRNATGEVALSLVYTPCHPKVTQTLSTSSDFLCPRFQRRSSRCVDVSQSTADDAVGKNNCIERHRKGLAELSRAQTNQQWQNEGHRTSVGRRCLGDASSGQGDGRILPQYGQFQEDS